MKDELSSWKPRQTPGCAAIDGDFVRVEPIRDGRRFDELFQAFSADADGTLWDWLSYGPFATREEFLAFAERVYLSRDVVFHAIVPREEGRAAGVAALMRIDASNGVVEIGQICLSPSLKRTRAATEAFFLLMRHVFDDLGYRRLEWKCNAGNSASKRAAERLGFIYEGTFRQHMVVKGRNRDTVWYSITDGDWPSVRDAFEGWLRAENFDDAGCQLQGLAEFRR